MNFRPDRKSKQLFEAILKLKTLDECRRFFRDLLTEAEIKEFANRWRVAQMLKNKIDYKTIEKKTGMSSTTIARVQKWLTRGMGGYRFMLKRLALNQVNSHHHTPTRLAV